MNVKQLITLALVAASAGTAMASEEASVFNDHFNAPATRAEVRAELSQARANGTAFHDGSITIVKTPQGASLASRDQVKAEARDVARNGTAVTENYMGS